MGKKKSFLEDKKITMVFATISLLGGFYFLEKGFTANVILNDKYSLNPVSFVGSLLILCSVVLWVYSLKKRN